MGVFATYVNDYSCCRKKVKQNNIISNAVYEYINGRNKCKWSIISINGVYSSKTPLNIDCHVYIHYVQIYIVKCTKCNFLTLVKEIRRTTELVENALADTIKHARKNGINIIICIKWDKLIFSAIFFIFLQKNRCQWIQ